MRCSNRSTRSNGSTPPISFPRTAYVVKQKTLSVMLSETKHLVLSALTKTRFFAFGSEWQLRHSLEAGEN